jgi:hypothetical protein
VGPEEVWPDHRSWTQLRSMTVFDPTLKPSAVREMSLPRTVMLEPCTPAAAPAVPVMVLPSTRRLEPDCSQMAEIVAGQVTRELRIVTFEACTTMQPTRSTPSSTVPGVFTTYQLLSGSLRRAAPAGTPVLPAPGQASAVASGALRRNGRAATRASAMAAARTCRRARRCRRATPCNMSSRLSVRGWGRPRVRARQTTSCAGSRSAQAPPSLGALSTDQPTESGPEPQRNRNKFGHLTQ